MLLHGMTRAEVDELEAKDFALGGPPMRPRHAATLILIDGRGANARVLVGKRHPRHAFMPTKLVFPGGRTDPSDRRVKCSAALDPREALRIAGSGSRASAGLGRAIALSAIREAYEEAGILLGQSGPFSSTLPAWRGFMEHAVVPGLDRLRLVGRAITPPGRVRRFDARFLAAHRRDVAVELPGGGPSGELGELTWLPIGAAKAADVPAITRTILEELQRRLADDPDLTPGVPAPLYRLHRNLFVREWI